MLKIKILELNKFIRDYNRTKGLVTKIIAEEYAPILQTMKEMAEEAAPRRYGFLSKSFGLKQKTYQKSVLFSIVGVTGEKFPAPIGKSRTARPVKYFHLVTGGFKNKFMEKRTIPNPFFDRIKKQIIQEVSSADKRIMERITKELS